MFCSVSRVSDYEHTAACFTKHLAYPACYIVVPKPGLCHFSDRVPIYPFLGKMYKSIETYLDPSTPGFKVSNHAKFDIHVTQYPFLITWFPTHPNFKNKSGLKGIALNTKNLDGYGQGCSLCCRIEASLSLPWKSKVSFCKTLCVKLVHLGAASSGLEHTSCKATMQWQATERKKKWPEVTWSDPKAIRCVSPSVIA